MIGKTASVGSTVTSNAHQPSFDVTNVY